MENATMKKGSKLSLPGKLLALATAALLIFSFLTAAINSVGFSVKVTRMSMVMDNGASYSALMYCPKDVTNDNPAPGVILVHGNSTSATQQSSHAIELARRGYVVVSMDIAGRGQSELGEGLKDAELTPSLICWLDYMVDCPLVDKDQIILSSHSMGRLLCDEAINSRPGVVATWIANGTSSTTEAIERGINVATFGGEAELKTLDAFYELFSKQTGVDPSEIEENKIYEVDGLKFACAIAPRTHAGAFWSKDGIASLCNYIQAVHPTDNYFDGYDQIWQYCDAASMCGMISLVAFMLAMVNALIHTSFFSIVKQPLPRVIGLPKVGYAISVVIAVCAVFFGFGKFAMLYKKLLPSTSTLFPTIIANGMVTFVMCTTLISIIMGTLFLCTDAKKHNAKLYDLGVTTAGNTKLCGELIWKSALIALIVVFSVFTWLKIMEDVSGANFQCACMGVNSITPLRVRIALPYMAFYFVNFLVSGFSHNVERRLPSTGNAKKDHLLALLVNVIIGTLGIALYVAVVVAYDYATPGSNNAPAFMSAGLHTLFSYGLIWFMASTTAISTACFRMTGSIWTGAFLNAMYCGCTLLSTVPMTAIVR